jgi:hypothetical protein
MFEKSEKYRKYIVEVHLSEFRGYIIWGANMEDEDQDAILIKNKHVVLFNNLQTLSEKILSFSDYFFDRKNFNAWAKEENLLQLYSTIHLSLLRRFEESTLSSKETALKLLDAINLTQDFFIQTNDEKVLRIYNTPEIKSLKDFIYNGFFWKCDKKEPMPEHINTLKVYLSGLYDEFLNKISVVEN